MKYKFRIQSEFTKEKTHLIVQLRQTPERRVGVQSILEIVRNPEGPGKTADEVEELLIQEMRRLGHLTLSQWAIRAEERVSAELKSQDPTVRSRKKNAEVVVRLWISGGGVAELAGPKHQSPPGPGPASGEYSPRGLAA